MEYVSSKLNFLLILKPVLRNICFFKYTKTQYRNQLFKKFSIDIETKFLSDLGDQENVFKLNKSELSNRIVGNFA